WKSRDYSCSTLALTLFARFRCCRAMPSRLTMWTRTPRTISGMRRAIEFYRRTWGTLTNGDRTSTTDRSNADNASTNRQQGRRRWRISISVFDDLGRARLWLDALARPAQSSLAQY